MERIYFVSQYDGQVHNINDYGHIISEDGFSADIGAWVQDGDDKGKDTLRVSEEVSIWTIIEIVEFYKKA